MWLRNRGYRRFFTRHAVGEFQKRFDVVEVEIAILVNVTPSARSETVNLKVPVWVANSQCKVVDIALIDDAVPIHVAPIYWEHEGNAGVRWGKWKLVREYKKPWELYDLDADRAEMRDLAGSHAAKKAEMVALWTQWARSNQVAFPERFNMYEFLREKKRKQQQAPAKAE